MSKSKIVSIFLVGILLISAIGVGQASMPTNVEDKDKKDKLPQKINLQVEKVTVHNWSFTVGPDDSVDRTVYVDPVTIKDKKYKVDLKKLGKSDDMSDLATSPAKKQAEAYAKKNVDIKEGETVRICIKKIHIENVNVMVKLPKQTPNSMQMSETQVPSMDSDKPGYMVTINKLSIDKWSFVVGPKKKVDKTITLGDISVKDRVIHVDSSNPDNEETTAVKESIEKKVKQKMAEKGAKKGQTYRVIIQNVNIENVSFVFGNPDVGDVPEKPGTTTEEDTTTSEEGDTTTTTTSSSGSDGDNGDDGSETTNEEGMPGFGVGVALLALLGVGILAVRREE